MDNILWPNEKRDTYKERLLSNLESCKELNAVKEKPECDGSFCRYCGPTTCTCDGYGNEQPSEKKESEAKYLELDIRYFNLFSKTPTPDAMAEYLVNKGWSKKEGKDG